MIKKHKQRKSKHKGNYVIISKKGNIHIDIYSPINSSEINKGQVFDKNSPVLIYLNGGPGALGFPNLTRYIDTRSMNFLMMHYFGCHSTDTIKRLKTYGIDEILSMHTLENFIDDVDLVLDYFNIRRVRFLANCFGTLIALRYAHKYPHKVDQIILATPYTHMVLDDEEYFKNTVKNGKFSKDKKAIELYSDLLNSAHISPLSYDTYFLIETLYNEVKNEIQINDIFTNENSPILKSYLGYVLYLSFSNQKVLSDGFWNRYEFIRYALYELHWAKHKYFLNEDTNYSLESTIVDLVKNDINLKLIYNSNTAFFSPHSLSTWKKCIGEENIMYFTSDQSGLYAYQAKNILLKTIKADII
jgi:pimeloyl-ACP methyl ester carboxylesterase